PRWGRASSLASCRSSTRVRPLHPSELAAPTRRWPSTKRRCTGCSKVSRAWATKCSRPWLATPASAYGKPTRCWRGFLAPHAISLSCEKGTGYFSSLFARHSSGYPYLERKVACPILILLLFFRVEIESGPNFVKNFTLLSFPAT